MAGDRLFSNKNTGFASPIKKIKNQRINIKRQLVTIKLSISVNSREDFVSAQKKCSTLHW